ncbi:MAG: tetratricopeptide repeat protein [Myxococcales bacterium]
MARGWAFKNLSLYPEATSDLERAAHLSAETGAEAVQSFALLNLAQCRLYDGGNREARFAIEHAAALARTAQVPELTGLVEIAASVVSRRVGDEPQVALEHARKAQAILAPAIGADHPLVAAAAATEGIMLDAAGDHAAAIAAFERALELRERVLGEEHSLVAANLAQLGVALLATDLGRARGAFERCHAVALRVCGPACKNTLWCQGTVALSTGLLGRVDEALSLFVDVEAKAKEAGVRAELLGMHAELLVAFDRGGEALGLLETALELRARSQRRGPQPRQPARAPGRSLPPGGRLAAGGRGRARRPRPAREAQGLPHLPRPGALCAGPRPAGLQGCRGRARGAGAAREVGRGPQAVRSAVLAPAGLSPGAAGFEPAALTAGRGPRRSSVAHARRHAHFAALRCLPR